MQRCVFDRLQIFAAESLLQQSRSFFCWACRARSVAGLYSTLPGLSQGRPCGCAAASQRPLPNAPRSKSSGQQRTPGTCPPLHIQLLQQHLYLKHGERNWKEKGVRKKSTQRNSTPDENHPSEKSDGLHWLSECESKPKRWCWNGRVWAVHVPTCITPVKRRAVL